MVVLTDINSISLQVALNPSLSRGAYIKYGWGGGGKMRFSQKIRGHPINLSRGARGHLGGDMLRQ